MAVLDIKKQGDPVLRQKAKLVQQVDARIRRLLDDMVDTMYAARGIGLAAPQVGISQRVIVVDIGDGPIRMVNPKIVGVGEEEEEATEGCLSIPGIVGEVWRSYNITVRGLDENGKPVKLDAEGLLARVFQHEIDHLDGRLFIDIATDVREATAKELEEETEEEGALRRE